MMACKSNIKDTTFNFHNERDINKWSHCDDEWGRERGIPANDLPNTQTWNFVGKTKQSLLSAVLF